MKKKYLNFSIVWKRSEQQFVPLAVLLYPFLYNILGLNILNLNKKQERKKEIKHKLLVVWTVRAILAKTTN